MRRLLLVSVLAIGCGGGGGDTDGGGDPLDGGATMDAGKDDAGRDVDSGEGWTSCSMYLAGGGEPGDACTSSFTECSDGVGCCNTYSCSGGMVVVTPPECDGPCIMDTACEGYEPPVERALCRSDADCGSDDMDCLAPGDPEPPCCGICFDPEQECDEFRDCDAGYVCESTEISCSCGGPATRCVVDCRTAETCPDPGQVCDTGTGLCRARNCSEGAACPASATCVGGNCIRRTCTADSDCDCGACVDRRCHDGQGSCIVTAPICA